MMSRYDPYVPDYISPEMIARRQDNLEFIEGKKEYKQATRFEIRHFAFNGKATKGKMRKLFKNKFDSRPVSLLMIIQDDKQTYLLGPNELTMHLIPVNPNLIQSLCDDLLAIDSRLDLMNAIVDRLDQIQSTKE